MKKICFYLTVIITASMAVASYYFWMRAAFLPHEQSLDYVDAGFITFLCGAAVGICANWLGDDG